MDLEIEEIPASPRSNKRRRNHQERHQFKSKKNKLSLKRKHERLPGAHERPQVTKLNNSITVNDGLDSGDHIMNEPLTSKAAKNAVDCNQKSQQKFDIYASIGENSDAINCEQFSCKGIDILASAKLLERADSRTFVHDKNRSASILRSIPQSQDGFVALSQIVNSGESRVDFRSHRSFKIEKTKEISVDERPTTPNNKSNMKFETQFLSETETQLINACKIVDVAETLLTDKVPFSQWVSPLRRHSVQRLPEKSLNIVESILNDFDFDSPTKHGPVSANVSTDLVTHDEKENNFLSVTPPLIVKRDNLRTYSSMKAKKLSSAKKLYFDHIDSDSNNDSDSDDIEGDYCDYENAVLLNKSIMVAEDAIDLDLNCSRNIIENIANLSSYFSQSNFVEEMKCENVISGECDLSTITIDPAQDLQVQTDSFGVLTDRSLLYDHFPTDDVLESPVFSTVSEKNPIRLDQVEMSDRDKSLLDEDEDLLMNVKCSQVFPNPLNQSSAKQILISATPSRAGHTNKNEIENEVEAKDLLLPKRLTFDSPIKKVTVIDNGFSTGRGNAIQISTKALTRSTKIFAELDGKIETDFFGNKTSSVLHSTSVERTPFEAPGEMLGFQTGRGKSVKISDKNLHKYAKLYVEMAEQDNKDTSGMNLNAETPQPKTELRQSNTSSLEAISENQKLCGFSTGRGNSIKISEKSLQRSAALFDEIKEAVDLQEISTHSVLTDRNPTSNIETSALASRSGFSTGGGSFIKMPSEAVKKTIGLFDDIRDEFSALDRIPTLNQRDVSTGSFAGSSAASKRDNDGEVNSFKGFETAKGTRIEIQESALRVSEKMFSEIENEDFFGNKLQILKPVASSSTPKNSNIFRGFKTSTPNILDSEFVQTKYADLIENSKLAEESLGFLKELEEDDLRALFADDEDFNIGRNSMNDRKLLKKTCLTSKFDDLAETELNERLSSNEGTNKSDPNECPGIITEIVKLKRQTAFQEQEQYYKKRSGRVKPLPGALFVSKLIAKKSKLSDFRPPLNLKSNELRSIGVTQSVLDISITNLFDFKFKMWEYYPLDVCLNNTQGISLKDEMMLIMNEQSLVGTTQIASAFLSCPHVDPKLVPDNWIANSLKWIIWKLASMELRFPHDFATKTLNPENVFLQLKYRYDREIDRAERSSIRRIVERDDVAAKRLVLFVSNIQKGSAIGEYSLELSDGWYSIAASIDMVLMDAVSSQKIQLGTKLIIQGAELVGSEEACSPLEMPSSLHLKISANSTRRAKWDLKLGYYQKSGPYLISLDSIKPFGGLISRLEVFIIRVYPMMYVVRSENGSERKTSFRSEKVERRCSKTEDQRRLDMVEEFYNKISKEVEDEFEVKRKSIKSPKKKVSEIDEAEELWELLEYCNDPVAMELELTPTQKHMVTEFYSKLYDQKMDEISRRVKEKLDAQENKQNVSTLLKFRVIDARAPSKKSAVVSIWNPSEFHSTYIREEKFIELKNSSASGFRCSELQISAGRNTTFKELNLTMLDQHRQMGRTLTRIADINVKDFKPNFNEFDTVGFVIAIEICNEKKFQPVYIVDAAKNVLCINFWLGVKEYAYEDVIECRHFLAISQLDWRPSHNQMNASGIHQAFATEFTTFSENPKSSYLKSQLERLQEDFKSISDLNIFLTECVEIIEISKSRSAVGKSTDTTPLRTKSMNNFATPTTLARTPQESISMHMRTPKEFSPGVGNHVSIVQEKIEKLTNYGAPPPISPLVLRRKTGKPSFRKAFKSPLSSSSTYHLNDKND